MHKKILTILFFVFWVVPCFAQVDTAWVRRDNGPGNEDDEADAIAVDDSGNIYVTGNSYSSETDLDYCTIKYDPNGNELWVRRYNGGGYLGSQALDIAVDGSGNAYVTGVSHSGGLGFDYATIKYGPSGDELWVRRYVPGDYGYAIAVDGSGNVYVTGWGWREDTLEDDYMTIKYYPNGNTAWVRSYNGPGNSLDWAYAIAVDDSGKVYVTGISESYYYATITYYPNGDTAWVRRFGGSKGPYGAEAMAIAVDNSGNVYVTGPIWTIKYDPDGNQLWVGSWGGRDIAVDSSNNIYVTGGDLDYVTAKYYPNGDTAWVRRYNGPGNSVDVATAIALDVSGNSYVTGVSVGSGTSDDCATIKYYPNGDTAWVIRYNGPGNGDDGADDIAVDGSGDVYVTGFSYGSGTKWDYVTIKYAQLMKALVIKDGSAKHDSIPNKSFIVYKVHNDPPTITQDSLGVLTTDSLGKVFLPASWFKVGDSLKVERLVDTVKAVKHQSILSNMYYIKIDNGKFDATTGAIYYDTLTADTTGEPQVVIVDHTTIMYDLLVSVEWDADQQYLQTLWAGLKCMSNYLYDVSDGQIYLNKAQIYDNKQNWWGADMRIYADNMRRPKTNVSGIHDPGFLFLSSGGHINLPRKWFGDLDSTRNLTYDENPLVLTSSVDYRAKAHESGHYALGFYDEWLFVYGSHCSSVPNYGFMDDPYSNSEPYASEMSSDKRYEDVSCRNTEQYYCNHASCWGNFESLFEKSYDSVLATIIKPSERSLTPGLDYFSGPNNDDPAHQTLNYDVGELLTGGIQDYPGGARTVVVTCYRLLGSDPIPNTWVWLKKNLLKMIYQGRTADPPLPRSGKIRCLGFNNGDWVLAFASVVIEGKGTEGWLFGEGELGKSGVSEFKNPYRTSLDGDTLDLFLRAVEGDYPLIYATSLSTGALEYILIASQPFSSNPTLELHPDDYPDHSYSFQPTPTGYSIVIPDSIGNSGMFTLLALDDSGYTFFVNTPYSFTQILDTSFTDVIIGPQGGCELHLDTLNSNLENALILSSPYPPIRTGLDPQSEQAGETYSLSSYPSGPLLGLNNLLIYYADSHLRSQSETTLRIFKWNENLQKWEELCGFVDTLNNVVGASIDNLGIYAAFTTGYLRGDANGDGVINASDVVYLINYLFVPGSPPPNTLASGDVNCDGTINASDVVYLINYLFISGPPPPC